MTWLAIYTAPQQERRAATNLRRLAVDVFLPLTIETQRRKLRYGRFKVMTVERAFFPNYLFVRGVDDLLTVSQTPGVLRVVSCKGRPLAIPVGVIESLLELADSDGCLERIDRVKRSASFDMRVGDSFKFRSKDHILDGLIGRLESVKSLDSRGTVEAFCRLFGSERKVEVPAAMVGERV